MKLKELKIELQASYCDNPGKYLGVVEWESKAGKMELLLPAELSERILEFLSPVLQDFAQKSAVEMGNSILASVQEARQLPVINT